jgi:hypothetical protein
LRKIHAGTICTTSFNLSQTTKTADRQHKRMKIKRILRYFAIFFVVLCCLFYFVYRPWQLTWGATHREVQQIMVGDGIVMDPTFNATRAVTINASPEQIWPWIIQIGYKKAGFYSYDILDNDGIHSSEDIIPAYQDLQVGDSIPMSRSSFAKVIVLEKNKNMLLRFIWDSEATWAWGLYEKDTNSTRLVTRLRVRTESMTSRFIMDTFEIIMMRKCLLEIKRRAESHSNHPSGFAEARRESGVLDNPDMYFLE